MAYRISAPGTCSATTCVRKPPLGLRAAEYMRQGVLVPDELTIDIMLERVMAIHKDDGFILDGFPRNRNQAEVLDEALERRSRALDKVVYIEVSEQELVRRLAGRFSCRECQAPHSLPQDSSAGGASRLLNPGATAVAGSYTRGRTTGPKRCRSASRFTNRKRCPCWTITGNGESWWAS